jgi:hypothetical protein
MGATLRAKPPTPRDHELRGDGRGRRYHSVLPGLSDELLRARSLAHTARGPAGVLYSEPRGDVTPN